MGTTECVKQPKRLQISHLHFTATIGSRAFFRKNPYYCRSITTPRKHNLRYEAQNLPFRHPGRCPGRAGRHPDGSDTDDNQVDFKSQLSTNLYEAARAGSRDITITETQGVRIGQLFNIGYGKESETVTVATIGKPRVITNTVTVGDRTREIRTTVMDLTLGQPLKTDHAAGTAITDGVPTPGYANRF